jgi:hypothetical protein
LRGSSATDVKGIAVTDDELAAVNLTCCDFHGE